MPPAGRVDERRGCHPARHGRAADRSNCRQAGWAGGAGVLSAVSLSDVLEAIQGGFSTGQLWLTLVAEAAIPVFVIGLYATQRPQIGRVGRVSAVAYAYS